jgi:hypothetical protein
MYCGYIKEPTIILEVVTSNDLWIWYVFFGLPGSNNDINVLHKSHLFYKLVQGEAPSVQYTINKHNYEMWYYLVDGISPNWSIFVKTINALASLKAKHFGTAQEAQRKDVERAFGLLQARFQIVRQPTHLWDEATLWDIMSTCIIMHNMILQEAQRKDVERAFFASFHQLDLVQHWASQKLANYLLLHWNSWTDLYFFIMLSFHSLQYLHVFICNLNMVILTQLVLIILG